MAHIIEIDPFLPADDLVFRYRGSDYPVPADPPLPILFDLMRLNDAINPDADQPDVAAQVAAFEKLHTSLFEFFKLSTPTLAALPFGRIGIAVVTRSLLQVYGLVAVEAPTDPPTPTETTKTAGAKRRRSSRSSSGSQS